MKKVINIQIIVQYGSKFQSVFLFECLVMMMKTWRNIVLSRHKKNIAFVILNGEQIEDIPTSV